MKAQQHTNELIHESSPYLLQHAHNPVNWVAWNTKSLQTAVRENKLLIISIGYAACHWCHVMEQESFENEDVAEVMNKHFLNIKVDREERPDIDQIYMNAVQLMTGKGGWPLNCVALPDGRPIWGGTYFRKEQWINALNQLAKLFRENPNQLIEYADKLTQGIKNLDILPINSEKVPFSKKTLEKVVNNWEKNMDFTLGGRIGAPKFPMPGNYIFLLRYAISANNSKIVNFVNTTLTKMAFGGIFDQIGGGFARYSVDKKWHVPHFEKMLYDNAQLVSLYAEAYLATKNVLYKNTVYETLKFVKNELTSKEGAFYASLDADSLNSKEKLEEGAFYVWKKNELKTILKNDFELFSKYYNINAYGFWEHDNYVLIKTNNDTQFANENNVAEDELITKVTEWKNKLLKERNKRSKPRLDDKIVTSWNALMLKAYSKAYSVFNESDFLDIAIKNATFLVAKLLKENGNLHHSYKNGKSTINGYLEDYATVIDAFIALYQATGKEKWLHISKQLTDYCFDHFFESSNSMFYFTSNKDEALITRKFETEDNVIPASNSIMAKNLFKLSHYFANSYYLKTSEQMLKNVIENAKKYGAAYSNWLQLYMYFTNNFHEIAITGVKAKEKLNTLNKHYLPNKITAFCEQKSNLPLLKDRFSENKTQIYVCEKGGCKLPVKTIKEALKQIK